ncbi:MAG: MoxR family ATPase [Lachnospiraceae bacterium]|nr:MoxR family ATPase [Lachnospiraceae bacterium]MBQ4069702.1 MoxR family ATPase [Lachnospiraceae bacterium]
MTGVEISKKIIAEVSKVIVGKDEVIRQVMTAILANGNILIEDIPGVGKTTLAVAFSKAMCLQYNRVQFTPDVMPSDVTGFSMYNKQTNEFEYKQGAIMCNMFLADEINRTSSKTQSALLEAMEEHKVTVDGETREITAPFTVIATQNPVGSVGTHMLPESQMDRFLFKLSMGYPSIENEINMLKSKHATVPMDSIQPVITAEILCKMQQEVETIFVHDSIYEYIATIVAYTRQMDDVELGISPRGSVAITNAAKATAYMAGRDYVIPDDVKSIIYPVARHRIVLSTKAKMNRVTVDDVIENVLSHIVVEKK